MLVVVVVVVVLTASVHRLHMSKKCDNVHVQRTSTYFTHVQTCANCFVHILHMSKPVITFVFKVLRNGLLRYILYTCPNL